jgi:phosphopantetheinyl transferase
MTRANRERLLSLDIPLPRSAGGTAPVWILLVPDAASPHRRRELFALLDARERQRAWEIRSAERRAAFIAGHGWRRVLLSAIVNGVPASAWRFSKGEHGRPLLLPGNGFYDTSLSHAAGTTAVAVAAGCRVGVDIEVASDAAREPRRNRRGSAYLAGIEGVTSLWDWTLAEAVGKCLGQGLSDTFEIRYRSPAPAEAARLSFFRGLVVLGDRPLYIGLAAAPLTGGAE